MTSHVEYDAVVVGAGPNGLAAAITLGRAGQRVLVLERSNTIGGGSRTAELTLPGFLHDVCATVGTTARVSPFMRSLPLEEFGVQWIEPEIAAAHPLDDGRAALLCQDIEKTALSLEDDANAYRRIFKPLVKNWEKIMGEILGPLPLPPRHGLPLANFGRWAIQPASLFARRIFKTEPGRAMFAGLAGHSILPLEQLATTAFGLVMTMGAHAVNWPIVRGGTQHFADALGAIARSVGCVIETGQEVHTFKDIPPARAVLFDVTPRIFIKIMAEQLPSGYRRALERFRYGPGVCKLDYALSAPIPWHNPDCAKAGTLHLGGTLEEIEYSEAAVSQGEYPEKPFVILVQPTPLDPSRAPQGKHVVWAYAHVPHGSNEDISARIEAQIERFAPGFRDVILARHVYTASQMEAYNPNYVGGDINSGVQDLAQLFTRPLPRRVPYSTALKGVYLCSSSTPPGGGIHGMCGFHAAQAALRQVLR